MPSFKSMILHNGPGACSINDGTLVRSLSNTPSGTREPNTGFLAVHVVALTNPKGSENNPFYFETIARSTHPVLITNLKDLADILRSIVAKNRRLIDHLIISGHGGSWGFFIGNTPIREDFIDPEYESTLANRLQLQYVGNCLHKTSKVVLHSCDVGQNSRLLRILSLLLGGVEIEASTSHQYARTLDHLSGTVIVCKEIACKSAE